MNLTIDAARVAAKVNQLLPAVGLRSPEHFHLDKLFDVPIPPEQVITLSAALLEAGIAALGARTQDIMALVIIGLSPSSKIDLVGPTADKIVAELSQPRLEPPALYLTQREAWKLIVRQEEYRRPLGIPAFLRDDWYPEYRTQRTTPDDLFSRTIWVSHLPGRFVG